MTDHVLKALFAGLQDVVPSSINSLIKLTAPVEDSNDRSAALRFIAQVQAALPGATVVRLDQDLVSISDIAERAGRSRESVRLLVEGRRGPGQFPAPVGVVGDGIRVWPWALVLTSSRRARTATGCP